MSALLLERNTKTICLLSPLATGSHLGLEGIWMGESLGFHFWEKMEAERGPIRTLLPAPPQDCRLPHYAKLSSSLVSAASLTPALVYLPSPYSFPADLLVFGNQSLLILESRTTPPGAVAASAAGVLRAAWRVGTRHRPCQSVETISFMGCDYSQMLYSQLHVQFLISNKAF